MFKWLRVSQIYGYHLETSSWDETADKILISVGSQYNVSTESSLTNS